MKNNVKNFINAFLGALIFSIPAIILYMIGYLSSVFFMLVPYGATLFYKKSSGQDIINKKYNKSYTANYISTIFRQKIIPRINETAEFHAKIIENLSFPENFKKCTGCGKVLLVDPDKFVRKSRSKDGFSTRCKICDRNDRQKKKVNK